jgi:glycosyltransferase involved in cell wall biosynthesis
LRHELESLAPREVRRFLRRLRAEVRGVAMDLVPLPLFEVLKLNSFDPLVARASTLSFRTSGKHFLILSGAPMTDSGGGHRSAQLALELLNRAHRVTYVHRFPSRERSRLRKGFAHENLTHLSFREFSARSFAVERGSRERIVALCELPLPEYRSCARYLHARGAQVVYDCLNDWDTSLGGAWYVRRTEDRLLREVDQVIASSRPLKDALEARTWREVALVPNAVNTRLFARGRAHERPADLPRAEAVYLYVGSLWGDWFDWDLINTLARARPEAALVLIGEYRGQCKTPAPNLHFLGMRAQADLPAYLAHATVCLVPFKLDRMVRAVNPLKVYEYLAMGRPVVATAIPELEELPFVFTAATPREFVEAARRAETLPTPEEPIAAFVAHNSWKARVRELERLLGL